MERIIQTPSQQENHSIAFDLARTLYKEHLISIPEKWRDKKFQMLEGDRWKNIVSQYLLTWDFKEPLVCSFISEYAGIGKSHAAWCLFKKYIYEWYITHQNENYEVYKSLNGESEEYQRREYFRPKVQCITEASLVSTIKSIDKNSGFTEKDLLEQYTQYDILFLDEMFKTNEFQKNLIYEIINQRFEWTMKPTIITGNISYENLKQNGRIISRINNAMLINIEEKMEDMRPKYDGGTNG